MNETLHITVNGERIERAIDPRTLLVQLLREHLDLTGTHVGCDTAQCGACTVHLDGRAVKSCSMLALQAYGASVTTIEAIGSEAGLHPLQSAFRACHALQCGYCTPGMVMSCLHLLETRESLDDAAIREALDGNICRCTGYQNIVAAVARCAVERHASGGAASPEGRP